MTVLRWVGDGQHMIPGVPARDLMEQDIARLAREREASKTLGDPASVATDLIASGLYAAPEPEKVVKPKKPVPAAPAAIPSEEV